MKLGAYTACLHDRPLAEAPDVLTSNGLTSLRRTIELAGLLGVPNVVTMPEGLTLAAANLRAAAAKM